MNTLSAGFMQGSVIVSFLFFLGFVSRRGVSALISGLQHHPGFQSSTLWYFYS
jgi:hypothetical protein